MIVAVDLVFLFDLAELLRPDRIYQPAKIDYVYECDTPEQQQALADAFTGLVARLGLDSGVCQNCSGCETVVTEVTSEVASECRVRFNLILPLNESYHNLPPAARLEWPNEQLETWLAMFHTETRLQLEIAGNVVSSSQSSVQETDYSTLECPTGSVSEIATFTCGESYMYHTLQKTKLCKNQGLLFIVSFTITKV